MQLWRKGKAAVVQLAICFAIGALAPLAGTSSQSVAILRASFLPSLNVQHAPAVPDLGLLLIVTVTRPDNDGDGMSQEAALTRLGHTLRHVEPPMIWIVVGAKNRSASAVQVLRGTGVTFRHLTYAIENATGAGDDEGRQRNVALSHIERHRLNGVIHFARASGVYDLRFFQQLRQTRGIAAWPTAAVSSADQRVTMQGPTCDSSRITGWYSKDSSSNDTQAPPPVSAQDASAVHNSSGISPEIHFSGLGFRSSILWESERLINKNNSSGEQTQDFIQFVRQMAVGDGETQKGIPSHCSESQIMLWHLDMPRYTPQVEEQDTQKTRSPVEKDEDDYMT